MTQKYLTYIPSPNFNYGTKDYTSNYFSPLTTNNSYYAFSGRLDFDLAVAENPLQCVPHAGFRECVERVQHQVTSVRLHD